MEFNLVAASSGSLGEGVFNYHQTVLRRHGVDTSQHNHRVNIVRGNAVLIRGGSSVLREVQSFVLGVQ